jgi:hypothetical protein
MKSGLKVKRRQKKGGKSREKKLNFFCVNALLLGRKNVINKKGLFYFLI